MAMIKSNILLTFLGIHNKNFKKTRNTNLKIIKFPALQTLVPEPWILVSAPWILFWLADSAS
jgi:hypothetical protein